MKGLSFALILSILSHLAYSAEVEEEITRNIQPEGRIDALFLAGDTSRNGFTIPSLRLGLAGEVEKIGYRLALGQTREFSNTLLTQILPVEARLWLKAFDSNDFSAKWSVGLFTPETTPFWTQDLSQTWIPDLSHLETNLLISRDLGTEFQVGLLDQRLKMTAGVFNGNGILAQNYNNSRAFTGNVQWSFTEDLRLKIGALGYQLNQANAESPNYRSKTVIGAYTHLEELIELYLSGLVAQFDDATTRKQYLGLSALMAYSWLSLKFFLKLELEREVGGALKQHYQIGPQWKMSPHFMATLLYDYSDFFSTNGALQTVQFRFRLIF